MPPHDNYADAFEITGANGSKDDLVFDGATWETGEHKSTWYPSAGSIWLKWNPSSKKIITLNAYVVAGQDWIDITGQSSSSLQNFGQGSTISMYATPWNDGRRSFLSNGNQPIMFQVVIGNPPHVGTLGISWEVTDILPNGSIANAIEVTGAGEKRELSILGVDEDVNDPLLIDPQSSRRGKGTVWYKYQVMKDGMFSVWTDSPKNYSEWADVQEDTIVGIYRGGPNYEDLEELSVNERYGYSHQWDSGGAQAAVKSGDTVYFAVAADYDENILDYHRFWMLWEFSPRRFITEGPRPSPRPGSHSSRVHRTSVGGDIEIDIGHMLSYTSTYHSQDPVTGQYLYTYRFSNWSELTLRLSGVFNYNVFDPIATPGAFSKNWLSFYSSDGTVRKQYRWEFVAAGVSQGRNYRAFRLRDVTQGITLPFNSPFWAQNPPPGWPQGVPTTSMVLWENGETYYEANVRAHDWYYRFKDPLFGTIQTQDRYLRCGYQESGSYQRTYFNDSVIANNKFTKAIIGQIGSGTTVDFDWKFLMYEVTKDGGPAPSPNPTGPLYEPPEHDSGIRETVQTDFSSPASFLYSTVQDPLFQAHSVTDALSSLSGKTFDTKATPPKPEYTNGYWSYAKERDIDEIVVDEDGLKFKIPPTTKVWNEQWEYWDTIYGRANVFLSTSPIAWDNSSQWSYDIKTIYQVVNIPHKWLYIPEFMELELGFIVRGGYRKGTSAGRFGFSLANGSRYPSPSVLEGGPAYFPQTDWSHIYLRGDTNSYSYDPSIWVTNRHGSDINIAPDWHYKVKFIATNTGLKEWNGSEMPVELYAWKVLISTNEGDTWHYLGNSGDRFPYRDAEKVTPFFWAENYNDNDEFEVAWDFMLNLQPSANFSVAF
jgi:hypothetical protein